LLQSAWLLRLAFHLRGGVLCYFVVGGTPETTFSAALGLTWPLRSAWLSSACVRIGLP
jgi:hypothetical protein